MPKTFEVSVETAAIIADKAMHLRVTEDKALEILIDDFAPSSRADHDLQRSRKLFARAEFFDRNPDATPERAWNDGYLTGWEEFQRRKIRSPFNQVDRSGERWPNV